MTVLCNKSSEGTQDLTWSSNRLSEIELWTGYIFINSSNKHLWRHFSTPWICFLCLRILIQVRSLAVIYTYFIPESSYKKGQKCVMAKCKGSNNTVLYFSSSSFFPLASHSLFHWSESLNAQLSQDGGWFPTVFYCNDSILLAMTRFNPLWFSKDMSVNLFKIVSLWSFPKISIESFVVPFLVWLFYMIKDRLLEITTLNYSCWGAKDPFNSNGSIIKLILVIVDVQKSFYKQPNTEMSKELRHFSKEGKQMTNKHMKRCSRKFKFKAIQIQITNEILCTH